MHESFDGQEFLRVSLVCDTLRTLFCLVCDTFDDLESVCDTFDHLESVCDTFEDIESVCESLLYSIFFFFSSLFV